MSRFSVFGFVNNTADELELEPFSDGIEACSAPSAQVQFKSSQSLKPDPTGDPTTSLPYRRMNDPAS
jgi:hypothetical protein